VQVANDAFPQYGFRGNLPPDLRSEVGKILSRWGDSGWGILVEANKHANHFDDELVDAVVDMYLERWQPDPEPTWVTCVTSLNHPTLVPDMAKRIADKLGLKFSDVVKKIKQNQPQKLMNNRYYQCNNLDGAFCIEGKVIISVRIFSPNTIEPAPINAIFKIITPNFL